MAQLTNTTNYSSEVLAELYRVLTTGFASREKGLIRVIPGVAKQLELPKIVGGENPIGAYAAGSPSGETASAAYSKRSLTVAKSMIYMEFIPSAWLELWPMFRAVGDMTNLAMSPEILAATLEIIGNQVGNQLDRLIWQGNNTLTSPSPLRFIDGFVKLAGADASVVDVPNLGAITKDNVFEILEGTVEYMTDLQIEDPSFKIVMNSGDALKMKLKNKELRSAYNGYLDTNEGSSFYGKEIIAVPGLPANTVFATKVGMDAQTNLFMGAWVDPDAEFEAVRIMRVANNSDTWFLRVNFNYGVQYRNGSDIVMYQGS